MGAVIERPPFGAAVIYHADGRIPTPFKATADTDAARGVAILAAQTAAVSGDEIWVATGGYTISSALGKNGVNWRVALGATITANGTASVWSDGGSALTFSVDGGGTFITTDAHCVNLTAGSNITLIGYAVHAFGTNKAAVRVLGGTLRIYMADRIESDDYDAILTENPGGTIYFRTKDLIPGSQGDAIEITGGTVIGDADEIHAAGDIGIWGSIGTIVVRAKRITNCPVIVDDLALCIVEADTVTGTAIPAAARRIGGVTPGATGLALLDDATASAARDTLGASSGLFPASVLASNVKTRTIAFACFGPVSSVVVGDGAAEIYIPASLNGFNITSVHAKVRTAGTTGTTDIQLRRVRAGTPADVLSTKLTVDSAETGSETATPAVINASNDDLATGDYLYVDVDAVSTTPPKGLIVTIELSP